MITILAADAATAKAIAHAVGAYRRDPDYYESDEYGITWTAGRIVELAPPSAYGYPRPAAESLPLIPASFKLIIRQQQIRRGLITDPAAVRRLQIIDRLFSRSQSIVVATEASGEGELLFRWIYAHLGCTKPFRRLWISSLTDDAIREGLRHLYDSHDFDALYEAADCRAKADWLVSFNASQALAAVSGLGTNTLGRLLTPTLAMVCARYRENRSFTPATCWQLGVTLRRGERLRKLTCANRIGRRETAEMLYKRISKCGHVRITAADRRKSYQAPPLLYDLSTLQQECSHDPDYSPETTFAAAYSLYEKGMISYPSTSCHYIPETLFTRIPELLDRLFRQEEFAVLQPCIDRKRLARRSVSDDKISAHHALIPTGETSAAGLSEIEHTVYRMIVLRTIEAFAPRCEKEVSLIEATVDGIVFRSRELRILRPGWRAVRSRGEDRETGETDDAPILDFTQGETLPIEGQNLGRSHTTPLPLYTEATLLAAMKTADRENDTKHKAAQLTGLGTPAARAAIISGLFEREYIERSGVSLVPTERGLYLYDTVRGLQIADAAMAENWERALAQVERGEMSTEGFMLSFAIFTRQVTEELASLRFTPLHTTFVCPKCGEGRVIIRRRVVKCSNERCGMVVLRTIAGKDLTDEHIEQLFTAGKTERIAGFRNRAGRTFEAALTFDEEYRLKCVQPVFVRKE